VALTGMVRSGQQGQVEWKIALLAVPFGIVGAILGSHVKGVLKGNTLRIAFGVLMLVVGGGQEEFGWRGYAQEPLQERIGVIPASLVIGVIWGFWHLPLWFMAGDLHNAYSFVAFVIMTTSISLVYTWLYNASGKKLISVLFLHAMCNTAAPLLPFLHGIEGKPETAYWVYAAVNAIFGVIFAILLAKGSKQQQSESLVTSG